MTKQPLSRIMTLIKLKIDSMKTYQLQAKYNKFLELKDKLKVEEKNQEKCY